ncbi:hypothetical protein AMTR_s00018p00189350 [Amborella trichopoda]|uniref:Autophagy-related protein 13 N-terminal domain-containing protein n=1 Tax=Amborella trichopoda TaxID=13333 RepID=W1PKG2_AMBTC|nr:hypothetical protein AMTR_s00018p00189350 [Amborella trichopoda]
MLKFLIIIVVVNVVVIDFAALIRSFIPSLPFVIFENVNRNDPSDGKDAPDATLMFHSTRKSQDAAVGALVHMLRTAPPLRQDSSYFSHSSRTDSGTGTFSGTGGGSSFFTSRKTSEALDELQTYREMKNLLLAQSRTQSVTLEPLEATDEVA